MKSIGTQAELAGPIPADIPAEYRICIEQTRANFAELDTVIADIQSNMEEGHSLDATRVKAVFFSLYFGVDAPPVSQFAHCFAASETRTETVTEKDEDGNDVEVERIYNVFVPIEDMGTVYSCQRRYEIVRKRRRNFVVFRRGGNKIRCFPVQKACSRFAASGA